MNTRHETTLRSKKQYMDALRETVPFVSDIDEQLARFGGKGRGIHSKLDSLRPMIPAPLDKRLRYIEAAYMKALTERDWRIPEHERFVVECQQALSKLKQLDERAGYRFLGQLFNQKVDTRAVFFLRTSGSFAAAIAALCFLLLLASGTISLIS